MTNSFPPLYQVLLQIGTDLGMSLDRGFDSAIAKVIHKTHSTVAQIKSGKIQRFGTESLSALMGLGYSADYLQGSANHNERFAKASSGPTLTLEQRRWLEAIEYLDEHEISAVLTQAEKVKRILDKRDKRRIGGSGLVESPPSNPERRTGTK